MDGGMCVIAGHGITGHEATGREILGQGVGLVVVRPGLSTTVQDCGRPGWQRFGVPVSGALDRVALAAANIVVGNASSEAALECLYQGCELEVAAESARFAVAGGVAFLDVVDADGGSRPRVAGLQSVTAHRGERVRVVIAGPSISAYLAVEGGFALPEVLGSRSTYVRAALGGVGGRALQVGDVVPLVRAGASRRGEARLPGIDLTPAALVRVVAGPQDDLFCDDALSALTARPYGVGPASDRMGLRLSGEKLAHRDGADIVSDGIAPGAIQVPGDGLPIVMLADRQTTGGYAKIATVISADLPGLGRVGPGAEVRFVSVGLDEAEDVARALAAEIASWRARIEEVQPACMAMPRLIGVNLISGVIDAVA